nr:hypothetical protein GCM10020093_050940 [Planobispora longispora]
MLLRAETACVITAEAHERLASCHTALARRAALRGESPLGCDDRFHLLEAERMRRRALHFAGEDG